jgi:hypothetical protein
MSRAFAFDGSARDRALFVESHPVRLAMALENGMGRRTVCVDVEWPAVTVYVVDEYKDAAAPRAIREICAEYDAMVRAMAAATPHAQ